MRLSLGTQNQQLKISSADKALKYAELNKARSFTNSWGRTLVEGLKRQLPAHLQESERELSKREDALQSELAQSMSGEGQRSVKLVQEDLKNLSKEQSSLQRDLRQANPAYAEVRYPLPVAISDCPFVRGKRSLNLN